MKYVDKKLIKFLFVGLINTIIGAGLMFVLYNCAHCGYWFSSSCNYIIGGIVSFFLNKFFTFSNNEKSIKQVIFFILNLVLCSILAYLVAKRFIYYILSFQNESIRDNVSLFVGMCLYTLLNYFGQRLIVFTDKEKKNE